MSQNNNKEVDQCCLCNKTGQGETILFPHTYEDPSYEDFVCDSCLNAEPDPDYSDFEPDPDID